MADDPEGDVVNVANAVTDGLDIDWDAALAGAPADQRRLVEQLRLLSAISRASGPPPGLESVQVTRHWGPFDIIEELDRGSYGRVYRARDTRVDRDVAVKLLPSAADAEAAALLDEARALARVRHPNVVAVYGADRFDGVAGLWTEFIQGHTIEYLVNEQGPLSPREVIGIGLDLCAALSAVHAAGLVHRDVNARNVMREKGGRIVLLDFGGVKPEGAAQEEVVGTPLYMAPELFLGTPASPRSDLYALGVLLFLMLTKSFPVIGQTAAQVKNAHATSTRRLARDARPDLPPVLGRVLDRALAPRPAERFSSAGEMQRALLDAFDLGTSPSARAPRAWYRRGVPAWVAATMVVAAAAFGPVAWWWLRPPGPVATTSPQLTAEQWSVLDSYHDLADKAAGRGEWNDAEAAHLRAAETFEAKFGPWSPLTWLERARAAFARRRAGRSSAADADDIYGRALYAVAEQAGAKQPLRAVLEMARAENHWQAGNAHDASHAIIRAIEIRERTFRSEHLAGNRLPVPGFAPSQLEKFLDGRSPSLDTDGDWIPDVIELAVGLDPQRRDSDGDGIADGEEDTDGDGIANGLEWSLSGNLDSLYGFEGTADPAVLGGRWAVDALTASVPTPDRFWRVSGPLLTYNVWKLSATRKSDAMRQGWRLFLRGRPRKGFAFAAFDPLPHGPAFAIVLVPGANGGVTVLLPHEADMATARRIELPAEQADAVFELTYDPAQHTACFRVDGRTVHRGYAGVPELQEGDGLVWGTSNDMKSAPYGEADFRLVLLQTR